MKKTSVRLVLKKTCIISLKITCTDNAYSNCLVFSRGNYSDIADQEVEHLMENSDSDKDGRLSIQEIIDHHEIFVGSEATDYGEHLHKFKDEL